MEALRENAHVATFAMYHRHRAILAELAQERGVSRSALIRELLEAAYMASMGKQKPGSNLAIGAG